MKLLIICLVLIIIFGLLISYVEEIAKGIEEFTYMRKIDGLYIRNRTYERTEEITESYDYYGDWVCVNVRDMSFDRAVEVCNHEVGHEIFAEILENNPEKIKDVMEVLNE